MFHDLHSNLFFSLRIMKVIQVLLDVIRVFRHHITFEDSINIYENISNIVLNVNSIKREDINHMIRFNSSSLISFHTIIIDFVLALFIFIKNEFNCFMSINCK